MVSADEINDAVRRYANKVMADSNLSIVMIDGHDLDRIDTHPGAIVAMFHRESQHAMKLKTVQTQESTR